MNTKTSLWMAFLTMTALLMGVMLIASPAREAQAAMVNDQSGFTLLTSGNPGGDEFLFVIDKRTQKMVMYKLNGNVLELAARADFARTLRNP